MSAPCRWRPSSAWSYGALRVRRARSGLLRSPGHGAWNGWGPVVAQLCVGPNSSIPLTITYRTSRTGWVH